MWGWDLALTDWSQEQIGLLKSSWRDSTKKSYASAWRRWCLWAKNNNLVFRSPTGSDLARFLSDLFQKHTFSYNTILFHRSVVSTLCDPNKANNLSSHPLVIRILKAIALQTPKQQKPAIWDVDKMYTWLTNNHNPNFDLYECSRKTACILLLCSGRRVHDLTLLSIDPKHFSISDDHAIFWPLFGSKTDKADYRQSGWRLLDNKESDALSPVFWLKSLIKLSKSRRDSCRVSNLFLTVSGEPRAASRTVIANWVKSTLTAAGVQAPAGSVRSAVASKNWILNFPLDEILARGNWRSQHTFTKFYRREVKPQTNAPSIARLFQPVE